MEQITSLLIIVGSIVMFSPVILILYLAYKKAGQRNHELKELMDEYEREVSQGIFFPIRYASQVRFDKIWKFFPWEDSGILTLRDNNITFLRKNSHRLVFPVERARVEWIGSKYWPNGVIAWFVLRDEQTNYYFTSDTGMWATQSTMSTKQIYEQIQENLVSSTSDNS